MLLKSSIDKPCGSLISSVSLHILLTCLLFSLCRSMLAMASTAITSPQTRLTNPKCGPRPGLDGKHKLKENLCSCCCFSVISVCVHNVFTGSQSLEVQFLTAQLKIWPFRLQGLSKRVDLSSITIW